MTEHPLKQYFDDHFYFEQTHASDLTKTKYSENEAHLKLVITSFKVTCDVCNGWGHIATDK